VSRLTAAIIFLLIGATSVRADERPVVAEASPYVVDGGIVCDVRCGGIFSERITGTVKSGLPAIVELIYTFETRGGEAVAGGIHSFELGYDVWEDVYSVTAGDSTSTFDGPGGFDAMKAAIEHMHRVPIAPAGGLDPALEYTVTLAVAVHPLTGTEKRRVEGFVEESMGMSHETWREQALSVNELINRFFSRNKGASNRSEVFRSAYFEPGELPGSRYPVEGGGGGWFGETTVAMECEVR
jgi:hypothetical protein